MMTSAERHSCLQLLRGKISKEVFLDSFHYQGVEWKLLLKLLEDSFVEKNGIDVELALSVAFRFGIVCEYFDILVKLAKVDWHTRHEDVVSALDNLRDSRALHVFRQLILDPPRYTFADKNRVIITKLFYAIGNLCDADADSVLRDFSYSGDSFIRNAAERQIRMRRGDPDSEDD